MHVLDKTVNSLINALRWLGMIITFLMMIFIFIAVVGRSLRHPVIGDVEVVEYSMLVLIACGLSYTQLKHGHITIGLIVDHFPLRVQDVIDIIGYVLTISISWLIGFVFSRSALGDITGIVTRSPIIRMPDFPFKILIAIGFYIWGLIALLQTMQSVTALIKGEPIKKVTEEGVEGGWM